MEKKVNKKLGESILEYTCLIGFITFSISVIMAIWISNDVVFKLVQTSVAVIALTLILYRFTYYLDEKED